MEQSTPPLAVTLSTTSNQVQHTVDASTSCACIDRISLCLKLIHRMCYLLVIAAPESASPAIADISVGELSMWEERNASISMGVPDNYSLHAIGVAHHCSCGCVKTNRTEDSENNKKFIFASDAAKMIEMAARVARQLAFIVHWMSTDLDSEEFLVSFGPGISCSMLSQPQTSFELDQLVWVAG